jgi:hypothetical protein
MHLRHSRKGGVDGNFFRVNKIVENVLVECADFVLTGACLYKYCAIVKTALAANH